MYDVITWTLFFRVTGPLCEGNSPVTGEFPSQRASNADLDVIYAGLHNLLKD